MTAIYILFFILYSVFVFVIPNIVFLAICTAFNIILALCLKIKIIDILKNIKNTLIFLLLVFVFNVIFDSIISSLIVIWKLLIVTNFAFIFSKTVSPTGLANGFAILLSPLKIFKIKIDDIVLMLVIAFNFIPIIKNQTTMFKQTLYTRNIKLNLKTFFTKSHILFFTFFTNLFTSVNELEKTFITRNIK